MFATALLSTLVASALSHTAPEPRQRYEIENLYGLARHAADEEFNKDYRLALQYKREFEREMGIPLGPDGEPARKPTPAELRRLDRWFSSERSAQYAQASEVVSAWRKQSEDFYNQAVAKDLQYYSLEPYPAQKRGRWVSGPTEHLGKQIEFAPKFSREVMPDEPLNPEAAFRAKPSLFRFSDGAVLIRPTAFRSPAYLAWLLDHERMHVGLVLTPGFDLRNDAAIERLIRLDALRREEQFGLPAATWEEEFLQTAAFDLLKDEWQAQIDQGFDPYKDSERFRALELSEAKKLKLVTDVGFDMQVLTHVAKNMEDESNRLWHLRAYAHSQFVKRMTDTELLGAVRGWSKALELKAAAKRDDLRYVLAGFDFEAEQCGFRSFGHGTGEKRTGFVPSDGTWLTHHHKGPTTLEAAKVNFLLARACIDGEDGLVTPCNNALGIINQRWPDPKFKAAFDLEVPLSRSVQAQCLEYMRYLEPPVGLDDFARYVDSYWQQVHYRWRVEEEARREGRPVPDTRPDPPARGGGDSGGGCFWSDKLGMWICPVRPR